MLGATGYSSIPLEDAIENSRAEQKASLPPTSREKVKTVTFNRDIHFTFGAGDETLQYRQRLPSEKSGNTSVAYGQLKCLIDVLLFLNLYYNPKTHIDADLVYIGAAVGTNIGVLAKMFPMLKFHLYDPAPFNERVLNLPNITIYSKKFEEKEEKEWGDKIKSNGFVFMVSDIRNLAYNPKLDNSGATPEMVRKTLENEQRVIDDMALQEKWVRSVKPTKAFLKFRLPYYFTYVTKLEYTLLKGTIYRQAWQRPTSSETRFVPDDPDRDGNYATASYNIRAYENMLFFHNMITRQRITFTNPFSENNKDIDPASFVAETIGLNNDFDSVFTTVVICEYLIKFGIHPTLDGFKKVAKFIFEGAGDGFRWKYNLYGMRNFGFRSMKYKFEDGKVFDQDIAEAEEDPEQIVYPPEINAE
jgi:hypothetical protein